MRTIKEFNVQRFKCTVLHHNMKYTLKVEDGKFELAYKLGDREQKDIDQLEIALNQSAMLHHLHKNFSMMHDSLIVLNKEMNEEESDLDLEII